MFSLRWVTAPSKIQKKQLFFSTLFSLASLLGLSACNSSETPGQVLGQDLTAHPPITSSSSDTTINTPPVNDTPPTPSPSPSPTPSTVGEPCKGDNSQSFCVGLKYLVYKDSSEKPVVTEAEAISNLKTINTIWAKCKIQFQIDQYIAADPNEYGLTFNTANDNELDEIRQTFDDQKHFLMVTTGKWNRSGTLGNTGANAWAAMPGDYVAGVILESPVGTYPNILAHELGHYMNLDHAGDSSNLMSALIYDSSDSLTSSQCSIAVSALKSYWKAMLR